MTGISGTRLFHRLTAASALAAVLSLAAVPAAAAELPRPHGPASAQAWDEGANTAENRRHRHRHRHGGGIDGGDILAGVLILGGIAAVAGAVENNNRDRDYRNYPPPPPQGRYDSRGAPQWNASSGLDRAADICADAIERTIDPVGSVDSVRRGPAGWDVDGTLADGSPFACTIGNSGEITDIRTDRAYSGAGYDGSAPYDGSPPYDDGQGYDDAPYGDQSYAGDAQYDEDTYARLRASRDGIGG